ncbi:MAG: DUF3795 domain-containing protein [Clostridia bacterium]|nr:DUF3795 domain-containing protein [Clostridia bacterium]
MRPSVCGHDCSRCITYLATIHNDEGLRARAQEFYRTEMGQAFPLSELICCGCRSEAVFSFCRSCPFVVCAASRGVETCTACADFPCAAIRTYQEKYVNKSNQIAPDMRK